MCLSGDRQEGFLLVGRDRLGWRALCAALTLAILACGAPQPPPRLYVVKSGPYPLYEHNGDWLATRLSGLPLAEIEERIIREARMTQAQNRATSTTDGPWLHSGCIFDVQRTAPDAQDGSYVWAYGKVVRCDEPVVTGLPEPQMGMRPRALRIYDGLLGYFPASLLEPYAGSPPTPRPAP